MMSVRRVLIIGLSNIVRRRVLPALRAVPGVERIDVATRKAAVGTLEREWTGGVYEDYRVALDQSQADLVYISLVNSEHATWAREAISRGLHVLVDKPAFLDLPSAERMIELAEQRGVCLAEATVFGYHPQVEFVANIFRDSGSAPRRITAAFSFPPLEPDNFRYRHTLGGGALRDLGPYAAAVGRIFFGEEPRAVACYRLSHGGAEGVELGFGMLSLFSGGRSLVGQFGFDTVYRNRVDLISAEVGVELDRVFTTPPDSSNDVRVTRRDGTTVVPGPKGDAFAAFFNHVFQSITAHQWSSLVADLRSDTRTLQRLREAARAE